MTITTESKQAGSLISDGDRTWWAGVGTFYIDRYAICHLWFNELIFMATTMGAICRSLLYDSPLTSDGDD